MKKLRTYFFSLFILGSVGAIADEPNLEIMAGESWNFQSPDSINVFLERVDVVIGMLNSGDVDFGRSSSVAQQLETRINYSLYLEANQGRTRFNPDERSAASRALLGAERYAELEQACVNSLTSDDYIAHEVAVRFLTKGLGSSAGKSKLLTTLNEGMESMIKGEEPSTTRNHIFSAAEGLSYLDDFSGTPVLESVMESDGAPPSLQIRAMNAAHYSGLPIESSLLRSKVTAVAFTAFGIMESEYRREEVYTAAIFQLKVLQDVYRSEGTLDFGQNALLLRVALITRFALGEGVVSNDFQEEIQKSVRFLVGVSDVVTQERIVSLFADIANDEDQAMITRLLSSESPRVRGSAARALAHRPKEMILEQQKVLIDLLEDENNRVRNFALFALRRGLDEPASTILPEAEFERQKLRVREKYRK